jgi:myo-inositol-1(or 4)-monophosphatase
MPVMSNYKDVAVTTARKAGEHSLSFLEKDVVYSMKNTHDIQAEADLECEKLIIDTIKAAFPEHSIFSEEAGQDEIDSEYLWIIDPIDGTINFSRHIEEYCVSIALQHKDEIILGVIYQPSMDKMIVAEKGKGAFVNGRKISVAKEDKLINCLAATDNSSKLWARKANIETLLEVAPLVRHVRLFGSAALMTARVAQGQLDIYFKASLNYWDYAAGILIVREAGGKATDIHGQPANRHTKTIVITSDAIHKEALALLQSIGSL